MIARQRYKRLLDGRRDQQQLRRDDEGLADQPNTISCEGDSRGASTSGRSRRGRCMAPLTASARLASLDMAQCRISCASACSRNPATPGWRPLGDVQPSVDDGLACFRPPLDVREHASIILMHNPACQRQPVKHGLEA